MCVSGVVSGGDEAKPHESSKLWTEWRPVIPPPHLRRLGCHNLWAPSIMLLSWGVILGTSPLRCRHICSWGTHICGHLNTFYTCSYFFSFLFLKIMPIFVGIFIGLTVIYYVCIQSNFAIPKFIKYI